MQVAPASQADRRLRPPGQPGPRPSVDSGPQPPGLATVAAAAPPRAGVQALVTLRGEATALPEKELALAAATAQAKLAASRWQAGSGSQLYYRAHK